MKKNHPIDTMNRYSLRIVIGGLGLGGTERHLSYILPKLAQRGFNITIITLTDDNTLLPVLKNAGITINQPRPLNPIIQKYTFFKRVIRLIDACCRLYKGFRRNSATITHFFLPEAYVLGMIIAIAARHRKLRVMSRRSLNHYQRNHPWLGNLESILHRYVHKILGNSQAIIDQLHFQEDVPQDKLTLIYNGVGDNVSVTQKARNHVRSSLTIGDDQLVFAIIANLIPYKGHADLLKALGTINQQLPAAWVLIVIGADHGVGHSLQEQAQQLGIADNIRWLGERHDATTLMAAADIGLLVSHQEGFSNAIIEAMAVAIPMVVTDVGGNAEAVVHQQTGLVVPAHDPKHLGQALLTLAHDRNLRQTYGQAGQQRYRNLFSLDRCVEAYHQFYTQLIKNEL